MESAPALVLMLSGSIPVQSGPEPFTSKGRPFEVEESAGSEPSTRRGRPWACLTCGQGNKFSPRPLRMM
jgi:hypothetical protein